MVYQKLVTIEDVGIEESNLVKIHSNSRIVKAEA